MVGHHTEEQMCILSKSPFVVQSVLGALNTKNYKYIDTCLKIIGNLMAVNDDLVLDLIQSGLLVIIKQLFPMATKDIKKSLLWVLSNIAANSE